MGISRGHVSELFAGMRAVLVLMAPHDGQSLGGSVIGCGPDRVLAR